MQKYKNEENRTVIPVCSAFIRKDGKYLAVYDPRFDFWRALGGKLKFNEKAEDALIREMLEEIVSGKVKIMKPAECAELKFVSLSTLKKMKPLEPALIDFFRRRLQRCEH
jgi:hypothetical protein